MPTLTPETWAQIRTAYEHTARPVEEICLDHGITANTLRDRVRRWGWTPRRRPPIDREGPPAVVPLTPTPTLPLSGGGSSELAGGESAAAVPDSLPRVTNDADASAAAQSDPAAIAARLQGAVAHVLPAIEASLGKLAAAAQRPREMEQTARALGVLMRTLRELNALLAQQPPPAGDDGPIPKDADEMRMELARRIGALVAAEKEREEAEMPKRVETAWLELGDAMPGDS